MPIHFRPSKAVVCLLADTSTSLDLKPTLRIQHMDAPFQISAMHSDQPDMPTSDSYSLEGPAVRGITQTLELKPTCRWCTALLPH